MPNPRVNLMPLTLVLVRHGESEENVLTEQVKDAVKSGADLEALEQLRQERGARPHTSMIRLTDKGRDQAIATGEWLRREYPEGFPVALHSPYARAMETAALLRLPNTLWQEDEDLGERDWGRMDELSITEYWRERKRLEENPFYARPYAGESLHNLSLRVKRVIDTLARNYSQENVIVTCHGEVMWMFRKRLERLTLRQFLALDASREAFDRIHNCQVIEYSRRDPETGAVSERFEWVRFTCPWNPKLSRGTWQPIVRPKHTSDELMHIVERHPRLIGA